MEKIPDKIIEKSIDYYCNNGFDRSEYVSVEDCIAKKRIDYGLDLTRADRTFAIISVVALIISVFALLRNINT